MTRISILLLAIGLATVTLAIPVPDATVEKSVTANQVLPPVYVDPNTGRLGVNFLGFGAEVGLGGGPNGGGLYAGAKTPYGQEAAAGLGGSNNGNGAAGGLFAGATATKGVGAVATLSGASNGQGVGYAAASNGAKTVYSEKVVGQSAAETSAVAAPTPGLQHQQPEVYPEPQPAPPAQPPVYIQKTVYRKRPHRVHKYKYTEVQQVQPQPEAEIPPPVVVQSATYVKPVPAYTKEVTIQSSGPSYGSGAALPPPKPAYPPVQASGSTTVVKSGDFTPIVRSALQIPIGILESIQQFFNPGSFQKEVTVHHQSQVQPH